MNGKAMKGGSPRSTTKYVLEKEKAKLLGGTVAGYDPDTISQEFLMATDLNPQIEQPCYHLILSYSYEDIETHNLNDEFMLDRAKEHFAGLVVSSREPEILRQEDKTKYKQRVNDFLENEIHEYLWFTAAHDDRKHKHTHTVVARQNLIDGKCIETWQDKDRSQRICREIEKEHGLRQVQSYYEIERRSPTQGQLKKWEQTGSPPVMVQLQDAIDKEVQSGRDLAAVSRALQEHHGIQVKVGKFKGNKAGVKFCKEDADGKEIWMSGSQLGRGYTLPSLNQRLEQNRDITPPKQSPEIQPNPIDEIVQTQYKYAERLNPTVQEIWKREIANDPRLKTVAIGDYEIRLNAERQPELLKRDRLILSNADEKPMSHGISEQDCLALEKFAELSRQQAEEQSRTIIREQVRQKQKSLDLQL